MTQSIVSQSKSPSSPSPPPYQLPLERLDLALHRPDHGLIVRHLIDLQNIEEGELRGMRGAGHGIGG